ncbi:MAG: hypothetical protein JSR57_11165, partial [Verrucomicrobia bacterium]|nr:hypothetical protein [Verrucomicrobiota bacterium]
MKKKQKSSKSLFLVMMLPLVILGAGLAFCCRTQGFNIEKISSKLTYNEMWGVP